MAGPLVFISTFDVHQGAAASFATEFAAAVRSLESTKPRTALYAAYADAAAARIRIVHAFPDEAAMVAHFEGADERAGRIASLVDYAGFEVLGPAPGEAVAMLRSEASRRGVELNTYPATIGGFLR